jgi:hypothetical protein
VTCDGCDQPIRTTNPLVDDAGNYWHPRCASQQDMEVHRLRPVTVTRQAQVPRVVADYFRGTDEHPVIAETFRPGVGWRRYRYNKRISRSWARKHLKPEGVTAVALRCDGRLADFSIAEVLR